MCKGIMKTFVFCVLLLATVAQALDDSVVMSPETTKFAMQALQNTFDDKLAYNREPFNIGKAGKTIWLIPAAELLNANNASSLIKALPGLLIWNIDNLLVKLVGAQELTANQQKSRNKKLLNAEKQGTLEVNFELDLHLVCNLDDQSYNCKSDQAVHAPKIYKIIPHEGLKLEDVHKKELEVLGKVMFHDFPARASAALHVESVRNRILKEISNQ